MNLRTLTRNASLFAAALAGGFIVAHAGDAAAARAIVPATACFVDTDYITDYVSSATTAGTVVTRASAGVENNSNGLGARSRRLTCPVPDLVSNPRASISTVFLDGYDGNSGANYDGQVWAYACLTNFAGSGYAVTTTCSANGNVRPNGATGSDTYTGNFDVQLATDSLNLLKTPGDSYANLYVILPHQGDQGNSVFYGFTTF